MTRAEKWGWAAIAIVAALVLLFLARPAAGADEYAFMPKGGKALALERLGADGLKDAAKSRRTEPEWSEWLAPRAKLTDRERATLAAYLAVNMPAETLPADGRELALNECQSCHSLFSSYLTQSRDAQGWRNIFLSPFHRQMKLDEREREEFARYSALNMPLKVEEIPADLRF